MDQFVIAGCRYRRSWRPCIAGQEGLVPSLAQHAGDLSPESRGRLLEFVRLLPQHDRTQPVPEPKGYEQYPLGFGAGAVLRSSGSEAGIDSAP